MASLERERELRWTKMLLDKLMAGKPFYLFALWERFKREEAVMRRFNLNPELEMHRLEWAKARAAVRSTRLSGASKSSRPRPSAKRRGKTANRTRTARNKLSPRPGPRAK